MKLVKHLNPYNNMIVYLQEDVLEDQLTKQNFPLDEHDVCYDIIELRGQLFRTLISLTLIPLRDNVF